MDAIMRGVHEGFIDSILKNEALLQSAQGVFEKVLECPVEKVEGTMFGYIVGRILQFSETAFQLRYQRLPIDQEALEIGEILVRRAMEIRSKIKLVMNR